MEINHREEAWNSITHLVAGSLSIAGLVLLVVFAALRGSAIHIVAASIYGVTLVMLYVASTFYHFHKNPKYKKVWQVIDHSAIFFLIAGTYTPFTLIVLDGGWGWSLFGIIWGLALLGILSKILFRKFADKISTIIYVIMGWMILIALNPLLDSFDPVGLLWLFAGGIFYSLGVFFFMFDRIRYGHTVWHFFVIAGSLCHFVSIFFYIML